MREKKKRDLEARGWRVGSAEEFLELTAEEMVYLDLKLRFAESLRKRRQRRKLTQIDVARLINSSQSRVAKMEAGDPSVSLDLLVRSLLALGASKRELAKIIAPSR